MLLLRESVIHSLIKLGWVIMNTSLTIQQLLFGVVFIFSEILTCSVNIGCEKKGRKLNLHVLNALWPDILWWEGE